MQCVMTARDAAGLLAAAVRPGHPDFLDLPWAAALDRWPPTAPRVVDLPRGEARHPVVFVDYDTAVYALKALAPGAARAEYELLREMERRRLPVVTPIGALDVATDEGPGSVLITRFLDHSLPYHALFVGGRLVRYRQHLLDALAGLLVQLHLAGVFWGDCSLSNTLFLRDAGRLRAYLVDAETSRTTDGPIADTQRDHDLDVMEENVAGALLDLSAAGIAVPSPAETAAAVRRTYDELWSEVRAERILTSDEPYRIEERVRALNALGFTVDEIQLVPDDLHASLRLQVTVADRNFHRDMLHSLTGLEAQENQARQMVNDVRHLRVALGNEQGRSVSLSSAAFVWLRDRFEAATKRMLDAGLEGEAAELYCELLEHKWFMSEKERADVGFAAALDDFVARFGRATRAPTDPARSP